MTANLFCEHCGRANAAAAEFCEGCGTRLASASIAPPPPPPTVGTAAAVPEGTDTADPKPPSGRSRRALVGAVLVVVGAVGGVVARELGGFDFALGERYDSAEVVDFEEKAREEGRIAGDRAGFNRGFEQGEEKGSGRGYDEGLADGLKVGEQRGYEGAGTSIREVVWSDVIGGFESGICVNLTGTYFLDNWRWEFEFSDGEVDVIDDSEFDRSNDGWCYTLETLARYTDTDRLYDAILTVYVTRSGLIDRWGPQRTPIG